MTAAAVSVIVVTYNSASTIEGCLTALARAVAQLSEPVEVIVWDSASRDATVAIVREHPLAGNADFRLVASPANLGFGGGNNAAAKLATAPLLLLLNPDAFLDDTRAIAEIRDAMLAHRAAIAGPFLANADGTHQVGDAGHAETLGVAALWAAGLNKLPGVPGSYLSRSYPPHAPALPVDWVCGACLAIERALFEELGGFDERIFLYSEDVDLCLRAKTRGARVVYVPGVRVRHIQGVSLADCVSTKWLDSRFTLFERANPARARQLLFSGLLIGGFGWRWAAYRAAESLSPRRRARGMGGKMRAYFGYAVERMINNLRIVAHLKRVGE